MHGHKSWKNSIMVVNNVKALDKVYSSFYINNQLAQQINLKFTITFIFKYILMLLFMQTYLRSARQPKKPPGKIFFFLILSPKLNSHALQPI